MALWGGETPLSRLPAIQHDLAGAEDDSAFYTDIVFDSDQSEDFIHQAVLQDALELGICLPEATRTTLNTLKPPPEPTPPNSSHTLPSTSDGHEVHSEEMPSLTGSAASVTSTKSSQIPKPNKVKRRIGRFSALLGRKRKTSAAAVGAIASETPRESTIQIQSDDRNRHMTFGIPTVDIPQPAATSRSKFGRKAERPSRPSPSLPNSQSSSRPSTRPADHETTDTDTACSSHETLYDDPQLLELRQQHLGEQVRFVQYRALRFRAIRARYHARKAKFQPSFKDDVAAIEKRHEEALFNMCARHNDAATEFDKSLVLDRRAAETALRNMESYCDPNYPIPAGMPPRHIYASNILRLEQERKRHATIPDLHRGKKNAFLGRQKNALYSMMEKQSQELDDMHDAYKQGLRDLHKEHSTEIGQFRALFRGRKARLVARWQVMELAQHRRLEQRDGIRHATMPPIAWAEGMDEDQEERYMNRIVEEKGIMIGQGEIAG